MTTLKTNVTGALSSVKTKVGELATSLKSKLLGAFTTVKNFFTVINQLFYLLSQFLRRENFADGLFAYLIVLAKLAVHRTAGKENSPAAVSPAYYWLLVKMRSDTTNAHVVI